MRDLPPGPLRQRSSVLALHFLALVVGLRPLGELEGRAMCSRAELLKFYCAYELPGDIVKIQILNPWEARPGILHG